MTVKLSYEKKHDRWVKMVRGQRFYSSRGASKAEAAAEYHAWFTKTFGADETDKEEVGEALATAERAIKAAGGNWETVSPETRSDLFRSAFDSRKQRGAVDLGKLKTEWLEAKRIDFTNETGWVAIRSHLRFFSEHFSTLDFGLKEWEAFQTVLKTYAKDRSSKYAASILNTVREFLKWASKRTEIDPCWRDEDFSISVKTKKITPFNPSEVKRLLAGACDEMKATILLCLNCSMTQKDVSETCWEQIDLRAGTLNRLRTKHEHRGDDEDVPYVKYHLWPETVAALKRLHHKGATGFVTAHRIKGRSDWYSDQFELLADGITDKTLKVFRKSGATAIGSHLQYRGWQDLYLANACGEFVSKTATKHYDGTVELPKEITDHLRNFFIGA